MLMATALWSAAGTYSVASVARARSLTNGTLSAANFSLDGIGGGEDDGRGAGAAVVAAGTGDGTGSRIVARGGHLRRRGLQLGEIEEAADADRGQTDQRHGQGHSQFGEDAAVGLAAS